MNKKIKIDDQALTDIQNEILDAAYTEDNIHTYGNIDYILNNIEQSVSESETGSEEGLKALYARFKRPDNTGAANYCTENDIIDLQTGFYETFEQTAPAINDSGQTIITTPNSRALEYVGYDPKTNEIIVRFEEGEKEYRSPMDPVTGTSVSNEIIDNGGYGANRALMGLGYKRTAGKTPKSGKDR